MNIYIWIIANSVFPEKFNITKQNRQLFTKNEDRSKLKWYANIFKNCIASFAFFKTFEINQKMFLGLLTNLEKNFMNERKMQKLYFIASRR